MDGKAKFIFPVVMTAMIVFVVSAVVTWRNIGFAPDFVGRWLTAFVVGWPVAAITTFFCLPVARKLTTVLVGRIEGAACRSP